MIAHASFPAGTHAMRRYRFDCHAITNASPMPIVHAVAWLPSCVPAGDAAVFGDTQHGGRRPPPIFIGPYRARKLAARPHENRFRVTGAARAPHSSRHVRPYLGACYGALSARGPEGRMRIGGGRWPRCYTQVCWFLASGPKRTQHCVISWARCNPIATVCGPGSSSRTRSTYPPS